MSNEIKIKNDVNTIIFISLIPLNSLINPYVLSINEIFIHIKNKKIQELQKK